jgi:putative flippase GtrA
VNPIDRSREIPFVARLTSHIPATQFGRYLLVGFWNTIFGYATYAVLTAVLTPHIPYAYILAGFLANSINITVAYFNYKIFVFKTKGNYLREWFRCVMVYSGGIIFGIVLLPVLVFALRHTTRFDVSAPYIAGALLMGLNVILSFFGHKNFSFARSSEQLR